MMYRVLSSKINPELVDAFLTLVREKQLSSKQLKKCSPANTPEEIEIYGEGSYSVPIEIFNQITNAK